MPKGQCHCGAVKYEMSTNTVHQALCHCSDCRRHSGAPMVAWGLVAKDDLKVPGQIDVQIAMLDDPGAFVPQAQIQTAERIGWMEKLDSMPQFERYPGP
jgi:hypothetical protein